MKILFTLAVMVFGCVLPSICGSEAEILVKKLKQEATAGKGVAKGGREVAEKLQAIGAGAVPYLLPLLRDKDEGVRRLASYTLRDIDGLTEQHLDALIESRRRGDGWIPPAIARIGTPKAVAFLVDELVRERQTQNQITWAIEILGPKAVPHLVQVYQTNTNWDENLETTMRSVFGTLGAKAAEAIDPLLQMANDDTLSKDKRLRAIAAVGYIGLPAERSVPQLQQLQEHGDAQIRERVTSAILNIGSAEAAPLLVQKLQQMADPTNAYFSCVTSPF